MSLQSTSCWNGGSGGGASEGAIPPQLETLLELSSLEDEEIVLETIHEASRFLWQLEKHLFCNEKLNVYSYRFLYSFIYEAHQSLHEFVSNQILLKCSLCLVNYLKLRKNLLFSLQACYDEAGVQSLDDEFKKWDKKRISSGLQCAPSNASASQSAGAVDSTAFPLAFLELFLDSERLLPQSQQANEADNGLFNLLSTLQKSDVALACQSLLQVEQKDEFVLGLIRASVSQNSTVRHLAHVAFGKCLESEAVKLLSGNSHSFNDRCGTCIESWAIELCQQSADCVRSGDALKDSILERIATVATVVSQLVEYGVVRLDVQQQKVSSNYRKALHLWIKLGSSVLFSVGKSALKSASQSQRSAVLSIVCLIKTLTLKGDQGRLATVLQSSNDGDNEVMLSNLLTVLRQMWSSSDPDTLQLAIALCCKELVYLLCKDSKIRRFINAKSGRQILFELLDLCWSRQTPTAAQPSSEDVTGPSTGVVVGNAESAESSDLQNSPRRGLIGVRKRLLLLVIALDVLLLESEDDTPLILKFQIRIMHILSSTLRAPFIAIEGEDMAHLVAFVFELLFEWAIGDFKQDALNLYITTLEFDDYLTYLQEPTSNTNNARIASNPSSVDNSIFQSKVNIPVFQNEFPKVSSLFGLFPLFINLFHDHLTLNENVLCHCIKFLAEIHNMIPAMRFLCNSRFTNDFSDEILELLQKNGEEGTLDSLRLKFKHLKNGILQIKKIILILQKIGTFALQCIVDRLVLCLNKVFTKFPVCNSLDFPNRKKNPLDADTWEIDWSLLTLSSATSPGSDQSSFPMLAKSSLLLSVTIRLLPLLVSGVECLPVSERCRFIATLFASEQNLSKIEDSFECVSLLRTGDDSEPSSGLSFSLKSSSSELAIKSVLAFFRVKLSLPLRADHFQTIILESFDTTCDVLLELSETVLETEANLSLNGVNTVRRSRLHSPLIYFGQWFTMIMTLIPVINKFSTELINDRLFQERFTDFTAGVWHMIFNALNHGPYALTPDYSLETIQTTSQNSLQNSTSQTIPQNSLQNSTSQTIPQNSLQNSKSKVCVFESEKATKLFLEFLDLWTDSTNQLLELVISQKELVPLQLGASNGRPAHPLISLHVEALTNHNQWVPRILQWGVITQVKIAKEAIHKGSLSLDTVLQYCSKDPLFVLLQKVCSNTGKGMTLVYKYFEPKLNKGHPTLPVIVRGDFVPAVREVVETQLTNLTGFKVPQQPQPQPQPFSLMTSIQLPFLGSATPLAAPALSPVKVEKPPTAVERPAERTSIVQTTLDDALAKFANSVVAGGVDHHHSSEETKDAAASSGRKVEVGSSSIASLISSMFNKRVKEKRQFDISRKFQKRSSRPLPVSSRIPGSLSRKLGDDTGPHIVLKLPSKAALREAKRASDMPITGATRVVSKDTPSSTPAPTAQPKASTILNGPSLSNLPSLRPFRMEQRSTHSIVPLDSGGIMGKLAASQQSEQPNGTVRLDPTQKKIAVEKAQAGLLEMMRLILSWNVFNLNQSVLGEGQSALPLSFNDAEHFKKSFQPLVLEECRCSILQGAIERKMQGFSVRITKCTRQSNDVLITARSDEKFVQNATITEDSVQDKDLEPIALQPWDLVLLIPRTPEEKDGEALVGTKSTTDNGVEGKALSEIKTPPPLGYALAIVEKDEDKDATQWGTRKILTAKLRMPFQSPQTHLRRIPTSRVTINSFWSAYAITSLTTAVREFQSLFMSHFSPLFPYILNPAKATEANDHLIGESGGTIPQWLQQICPILRSKCSLNDSQLGGLRHALTAKQGVALLQGPPGTGKTKTLLAIVAAIFYQYLKGKSEAAKSRGVKKKLLICAPSNAAVDEIAARILGEGIPKLEEGANSVWHPTCVRVGNPKRITRPEVVAISLEETLKKAGKESDKAQKDEFFTKRDQLKSKMDSLAAEIDSLESIKQAERFTNAFSAGKKPGAEVARKVDLLLKQKKAVNLQRLKLKDDFEKNWSTSAASSREAILRESDIVFATLSSSATESLSSVEFDCVIVDEAAQAVELSALIPLRLEPLRLILIGDPKQLPATVLSTIAKKYSYERSLFQRLQGCGVGVKMLLTQYRMRPEIAAFPAAHFYENRLKNAPAVVHRQPLHLHSWNRLFRPYVFFDIPSQENRHQTTQSLSNPTEAFFVFSLVRLLVKHFVGRPLVQTTVSDTVTANGATTTVGVLKLDDIAVITPYRQQVIELRRLFDSSPQEFPNPQTPEVCTVDAFQGREKKIILFSCVRSSGILGNPWTPCEDFSSGDEDQSTSGGSSVSLTGRTPDRARSDNSSMNGISTLGFVADIRRLNVALTRARDCLWLVGNAGTLRKDTAWRSLLKFAKRSNSTSIHESVLPPSARKMTQPSKSSLIHVFSETKKIESELRPPHLRKSSAYQNSSIVITTFLTLCEEFHLRQEARRAPTESRLPNASLNQLLSNNKVNEECSSVSSSDEEEEIVKPPISAKGLLMQMAQQKPKILRPPIQPNNRPLYNSAARPPEVITPQQPMTWLAKANLERPLQLLKEKGLKRARTMEITPIRPAAFENKRPKFNETRPPLTVVQPTVNPPPLPAGLQNQAISFSQSFARQPPCFLVSRGGYPSAAAAANVNAAAAAAAAATAAVATGPSPPFAYRPLRNNMRPPLPNEAFQYNQRPPSYSSNTQPPPGDFGVEVGKVAPGYLPSLVAHHQFGSNAFASSFSAPQQQLRPSPPPPPHC